MLQIIHFQFDWGHPAYQQGTESELLCNLWERAERLKTREIYAFAAALDV